MKMIQRSNAYSFNSIPFGSSRFRSISFARIDRCGTTSYNRIFSQNNDLTTSSSWSCGWVRGYNR